VQFSPKTVPHEENDEEKRDKILQSSPAAVLLLAFAKREKESTTKPEFTL